MRYTVFANNVAVSIAQDTAKGAVEKAAELMSEGMKGVFISNDQGRLYSPAEFHKLLASV